MVGEQLAVLKRYDEAAARFARAIELDPRLASAYANLAQLHQARGDLAQGERVLKEGLAAVPRSVPLELLYTGLLQRASRFDEAITRYESVLSYAPGNDVAANNLAALLADHRGDRDSLERALRLAQRFERSGNPLYLDTLGWAHYRAGDFASAVTVLERAVKVEDRIPLLHYHLGMALYRNGNLEGGRSHLRRAVDTAKSEFPGLEDAKRLLAQG
jgi:tetratricopeptide (TPR) repeat protein